MVRSVPSQVSVKQTRPPKNKGPKIGTGIYFQFPGDINKDREVKIAESEIKLMDNVPTITLNGKKYVDGDGKLPKAFRSATNFNAFKQKINKHIGNKEERPPIWRSRTKADDDSTCRSET